MKETNKSKTDIFKTKEFLSVREVASLLGCDPRSVRSIIKAGKLPATKLSERKTLIKRSDIDKLFEPWE